MKKLYSEIEKNENVYLNCYKIYKEEYNDGKDFSLVEEDVSEEMDNIVNNYKELIKIIGNKEDAIEFILDELDVIDYKFDYKTFEKGINYQNNAITTKDNSNLKQSIFENQNGFNFSDIIKNSSLISEDFNLSITDKKKNSIVSKQSNMILTTNSMFRNSLKYVDNDVYFLKKFEFNSDDENIKNQTENNNHNLGSINENDHETYSNDVDELNEAIIQDSNAIRSQSLFSLMNRPSTKKVTDFT